MMKTKTITIKYREPSEEEIADRKRRAIVFSDGATGIIMNSLNENGAAILDADNPVLTILCDATDWGKVKLSVGSIEIKAK
jgi:hypothetical protein